MPHALSSLLVCAAASIAAPACDVAAASPRTPLPAVSWAPSEAARLPSSLTPASTTRHREALRRHDIVVGSAGLARSLSDAGVALSVLDALDDALTTRLDVYAFASEGQELTLWVDDRASLVGVIVGGRGRRLAAARYAGSLAPWGFYDDRGLSLAGPLRSRPVRLSRVTSRFGQRFDPINGASRIHRGVDYAVPIGSDVLAAGEARVKARGSSEAAGNFIKLAHAGGFESLYLHLDKFEEGTEVGARVAQDQLIARSGNTGRSTGPHVHYELHLAGEALDPHRTMPIPDAALGPIALRQHRAFIDELKRLRPTQQKEATR